MESVTQINHPDTLIHQTLRVLTVIRTEAANRSWEAIAVESVLRGSRT